MVKESVEAGASGIVISRRLWQRRIEEAMGLLERFAAIVHLTTGS
jgi:DhnA family fructose-bisphosphate aldolase class Ia